MMAVTKDIVSANFCGNRLARLANRNFFGEAKVSFSRRIDSKHIFCNGSSRSWNPCDAAFGVVDERFKRPHAMPSYEQLVYNFENRNDEALNTEQEHRKMSFEHGENNGHHEHPVSEKLRVAVDVDEVLGSFLSALNRFIADRYSLNHSIDEYHVYEFSKIWNCSHIEANTRVHEFFETPYFNMGINPIPGAKDSLYRLSAICNFSIVTSRQNAIKHRTIEWIQKHFPDLFEEIHFGNHFALDGESKSKSQICRSVGARVLIDDNPRYAIECAEAGIRVILFDLNNSYPWCKTGSQELHPFVTKAQNWQEVEQQLTSWSAT